jgi:hypothetical protein
VTSGVERDHTHKAVRVYHNTAGLRLLRWSAIALAGLTLFVIFVQILKIGG